MHILINTELKTQPVPSADLCAALVSGTLLCELQPQWSPQTPHCASSLPWGIEILSYQPTGLIACVSLSQGLLPVLPDVKCLKTIVLHILSFHFFVLGMGGDVNPVPVTPSWPKVEV